MKKAGIPLCHTLYSLSFKVQTLKSAFSFIMQRHEKDIFLKRCKHISVVIYRFRYNTIQSSTISDVIGLDVGIHFIFDRNWKKKNWCVWHDFIEITFTDMIRDIESVIVKCMESVIIKCMESVISSIKDSESVIGRCNKRVFGTKTDIESVISDPISNLGLACRRLLRH